MGMDERDLELLSAYLDGRLNEDEQQALAMRLAQDALLRRELDTLRETASLLRALPVLKSPRNLTLAASLQQKRTPLVLSPWVSTLSAVAAAFMLIAGFVLLSRTGTFQTGQDALSQVEIGFAATHQPVESTTVPTLAELIAPAPLPLTATAPLTEEAIGGSVQAQEMEDQAPGNTGATSLSTAPAPPALALQPAPSAELPADASIQAAPSTAGEGAGSEAYSNADRAQAPAPSPSPEPAATQGITAESDTRALSTQDEQQPGAARAVSTAAPATPALTASSVPSPSPTAIPTAIPALPPAPPAETSPAGAVLIILGAVLLLAAVVTTLLRRRQAD